MRKLIVFQDCHSIGYTDSIIRSQRCSAVRGNPVPIRSQSDRVFSKIVTALWRLFADHIQMGLNDDRF